LYPIYVYDGVKRLNFGTDYTLSSAGMTKNTVKVSIAGKGNYTGTELVCKSSGLECIQLELILEK